MKTVNEQISDVSGRVKEPLLSVAINDKRINKLDRVGHKNPEQLTTGFVNYQLTATELADHINKGHAFSSQHQGRRASKNFVRTSVIAIDLDSTEQGLADIEGALADSFVHSHLGIFYHTASHRPDYPKARLVFLLDKPITETAFYKKAVIMLLERFEKYGADQSTKDVVRVFYGSRDSSPKVTKNTLKVGTLWDMVAGWEADKAAQKNFIEGLERTYHRSSQSGLKDPTPDTYRIRELLSYIPPHGEYDLWLRVLMAVHSVLGMEGVKLIEEWSPSKPGEVVAKFRSFEHNIPEQPVTVKTLIYLAQQGGWHPLFSITPTRLVHQKYLSNISLTSKLTCIKSPKGTGKTTVLTQQVADADRVLVIGHRITLLMEAAARHGLEFYQDYDGDKEGLNSAQSLAITLDSLLKLYTKQWLEIDLLVIDEVEQVLRHLTGDTVRKVRRNLQAILSFLLTKAKRVVVLDADLTDVAVDTIKSMADTDDVEVIVNTHKPRAVTFNEHGHLTSLINHLFTHLDEGKRPFLTTNTKTKADEIYEAIKDKYPLLKGLLITSDTSQTEDIQAVIRNINDRILDYDYIVTSPSLGTGISIDVAGINAVYLLAETFPGLSHTDLLQQVSRVRTPDSGEVHFHIKGQQFQPWTNDKVLRKVALRETERSGVQFDIDPATGERILLNDTVERRYLDLYSKLTARHSLSTNDLKGRFIQHIRAEGHCLVTAEPVTKDAQDTIGKVLKTAEKVQEEQHINEVLEAQVIDYYQYQVWRNKDKKTPADKAAIENYLIRDTYGVEEVTPDLVKGYRKGRARYQMHNYIATFVATDEELRNKDSYERDNLIPDRRNHLETAILRRELIERAFGCDINKALNGEVYITDASLEANGFKQWGTNNQQRITHLLKIAGKPDTKLVSNVLKQVGLGLAGRQVRGGVLSPVGGGRVSVTDESCSYIEIDKTMCDTTTGTRTRYYTITGVQEAQAQLERRNKLAQSQQALLDTCF